MLRFAKVVDAVNTRIAQGVFWLMLLVVLVATFNTIARYVGKWLGADLSSNRLLELQWQLFGVIFLMGGAYTLLRNGHVRVDVIYDRLPKKVSCWIDIVGHGLLLIPFCLFMVWVSIKPVSTSWIRWEVSPNPEGLPFYPIKTLIPVAFVFIAFQGVSQLIKAVGGLSKPDAETETVAETLAKRVSEGAELEHETETLAKRVSEGAELEPEAEAWSQGVVTTDSVEVIVIVRPAETETEHETEDDEEPEL